MKIYNQSGNLVNVKNIIFDGGLFKGNLGNNEYINLAFYYTCERGMEVYNQAIAHCSNRPFRFPEN